MKELISIIVPIYNAEKTLNRCLDSILVQTYKNLEILLINDGSTDNSLVVCNSYATLDERITVIDSPNYGVSKARNLGLEKACGKFIGFVDSDDWIETNHIELLLNGFHTNDNISLTVIGVNLPYWYKYLNELCKNKAFCNLDFLTALDEITKIGGLQGYLCNKLFLNTHLRLDDKIQVYEDLEFVIRYLFSFPNQQINVINVCTYNYDIQPVVGFRKLRYGYKRSITKFLAYESILNQLNTLEVLQPELSLRIEGYQSIQALDLLLALDNDRELAKDERSEYHEIGNNYFLTYYDKGMMVGGRRYRMKAWLYKHCPKLLNLILRGKFLIHNIQIHSQNAEGGQ